MFIQHRDAQLFTVSFGDSPRTLLALGGWAGSWEVWTETFTHLSKTWRAVAFDHRGSGATLAPTTSITVDTMVEDVFAVLDTLGIEHCVLAAESAGAIVALLAALRQPQRFTGLVLVDAAYNRPMPVGEDSFLAGLKQNFAATIGWFVDACVPEADSEAIRSWGRQILFRSPQPAAIQLYECMLGMDLRPRVGQINQPTLILQGEADVFVSLAEAEWLAAHMPTCRLQVINGAGHVPTVTRPREVAEAINQYFL